VLPVNRQTDIQPDGYDDQRYRSYANPQRPWKRDREPAAFESVGIGG
jgi:hypothetical protein